MKTIWEENVGIKLVCQAKSKYTIDSEDNRMVSLPLIG
jgi:hypothetical protein